ncbi:MAG TPA: hypothetical protein VHD84_02610 [Candidatus Saccharimonadales bacterium]|nr:hypothetical protein [Candidatus Saccharimonadales bacterium]
MKAARVSTSSWSGGAAVPELNQNQWSLLAIPAAVLAVMAILQLIGFGSFRDWLDEVRIGWPTAVAIVLIIAELWAAVSLLRVSIGGIFRYYGLALAVLVSGFWFVENLQIAAQGGAGQLPNSGFFGKYLMQSPGWWTILEVSIMLFWVVYAAELLRRRRA